MRSQVTKWCLFPADRYHLGRRVDDLGQDGSGVWVRTDDGTRWKADLLVLADGAGSTGRGRLLPGVAPTYAGYVAWRGTVSVGDVGEDLAAAFDDRFVFCETASGSHALCYAIPGADEASGPLARRLNWVWYEAVASGDALAAHSGTTGTGLRGGRIDVRCRHGQPDEPADLARWAPAAPAQPSSPWPSSPFSAANGLWVAACDVRSPP